MGIFNVQMVKYWRAHHNAAKCHLLQGCALCKRDFNLSDGRYHRTARGEGGLVTETPIALTVFKEGKEESGSQGDL